LCVRKPANHSVVNKSKNASAQCNICLDDVITILEETITIFK